MNLHYPPYSIDLNHEQQPQKLYDHQILLRSSPLYSNLLEDHQLGYMYMGSQLQPSPYQQEVDDKTIPRGIGGSSDQTTVEITGVKRTNLKFTICKKEDRSSSGSSVKWMPVRIMKKMMGGDEDLKLHTPFLDVGDENRHLMSKTLKANSEISGNDNNNTGVRVCSDCNTTKTPLWRSGPRGPKSLCNACGIRQRKARRAMAMATNGSIPSSVMRAGNGHKKTVNINNNNNNAFGAQKKRSKVVKPSRDNHHYVPQRKLWFEEFALKLSKKIPIEQVFPQEEKEAVQSYSWPYLVALSMDRQKI